MTALLNPVYRRGENIKWRLVCYTMVMFSLATVLTTIKLDLESIGYIDNRNFPGATTSWTEVGYLRSIYLKAVNIVPNVAFIASGWLADGFLVSSLFDVVLTRTGV